MNGNNSMNHIPFSKQAPNVAIAANHEGEADPRALQYAKHEVGYERFLQCSVEDGSMTGRDETDSMERGRIEKHGIPICAPGVWYSNSKRKSLVQEAVELII
ncbi:conserved hypothetical protein [Coccidioides posadasii str. Silveira]|uniref:Uncharacterized protein n=1 Tax=Coccidioides posadasii (strain RMSCC 757 / Silveira) TaxID=443226 RepID=E9D0X9_COCPS|nr:conserved hypothetical protein [Coccidioides posadasii str. Silveira]